MRTLILGLALALGLAGSVTAQNADIEATIANQFEAFQADDFAQAFTYASPMIRDIFRTPENFGTMVRNGYPMVWRPSDVRYLDLREIEGRLWQKVQVTDAKGDVYLLDYEMIEGDGGWQINGVRLLEKAAVSA